MEAQEIKHSLAEQGRQYLVQLREEGEFFYQKEEEQRRLYREKEKAFFKKLLEDTDNEIVNDK